MAERKKPRSSTSRSTKRQTKRSPARRRTTRRKAQDERILGTAPSSPDIRNLELMEPSEEAKAHEPSTQDAMGKDKRRQVIGHSYGPSRKSQLLFFGIFFGSVALIFGGGKLLADQADKPPESYPDNAPWSQPEAPQTPADRPM